MPCKALLIVATLSQLTVAEGEPLEENLFAPEVRLEAGGVPVDLVVGHAAPDFIVVSEPTRQNVGAVHSFNGGFGMSTPVIQKQITLWGLRYTPARLGITWDSDSLMVTSIRNPGLYDAGLLEGDTLISLDGVPFPKTDSGEQTWHLRALQNRPGQEAEIIWIRPGVGRMAATVTYVVKSD